MAEDAEIETVVETDTPVEAAPAAAAVEAEPAPETVVEPAPVVTAPAIPPRKLRAKAPAKAALPEAAAAPVETAPAKPARKPRAKAADKLAAAPAARRGRPKKVEVSKPATLKAKAIRTKAPRSSLSAASPAPQAAAAPIAARKAAPRKTVKTRQAPLIGLGTPKFASFKETIMATPFDLSQIKTAFTDIKDKAKAAVEKGTAAIGDANDFAKGNVEAVVESGKLFSAGLQDLGATLVADTRSAFEELTADAKELAAAKSPTEFFQLQSALARKQFDGAVAQASKSTEAWLKLANEAFAPLSSRVTLAVEKVSKAA